MLGNPPPVSPYVYTARDYQDFVIQATFNYDNTTKALQSATLHRDAQCVYKKIIVGVGPDGTPDTSTEVFDLSKFSGDKSFTANQMASVGLHTIDDVLNTQITAA